VKYTTISSKRQLTLSKDDLKHLGINVLQKVTVEYAKGSLVIRPVLRTIVDEVGGAFRNDIPESQYARPLEKILQETRRKR
jgi:hypothetical protein